MASKVGMNFAIQIKGKKRKKEKILSLSHTCIPTWPGGYLVQRESSLSSSSFYQIKYKNKKNSIPVWQEKRTSFCFGSFLSFFGWPTRFHISLLEQVNWYPSLSLFLSVSLGLAATIWVFFFSPLHSDGWGPCLKMAVIFSFLFSSCRVVTAQPIAPDLVITNFQTSSRRAKNLKGRRMRAVRVVCAQQRKNKKRKTFSLHTPLTLRQERPANLAMKMFYFVHFSSGFLFHL